MAGSAVGAGGGACPDEAPVIRTWGRLQLFIVPPRRLLGGRPGHPWGPARRWTVVKLKDEIM